MIGSHELVPAQPGQTPEQAKAQDNRVLGFWIFLSGECAFFAALIGTYLSLDTHTAGAVTLASLIDLPLTGVMTLSLLSSSLTMVFAFLAMNKGELQAMKIWLWVTALLGAIFLDLQIFEFTHYMASGFTMGASASASAFYALVGFHGLHVAFGLFWIISLLVYSFKDGITPANTSKVWIAGLYWHFVDVVWVIIFTVVYLMQKVH